MRCEDVIRELAAPTDGQNAAALAEHLETCPACAEWSARMASFDHLWARTRPADPSSEQWDSVWNQISHRLDAAPSRGRDLIESTTPLQAPHAPLRIAPGSISEEGSRPLLRPLQVQRGTVETPAPFALRRLTSRERSLVATAAAIFLIGYCVPWFGPSLPRDTRTVAQVRLPGGTVEPSVSPTAVDSLNIEEGELVVISSSSPLSAQASSRLEVARFEPDDGIDSWYVMFNAVESMANPVLAVR